MSEILSLGVVVVYRVVGVNKRFREEGKCLFGGYRGGFGQVQIDELQEGDGRSGLELFWEGFEQQILQFIFY